MPDRRQFLASAAASIGAIGATSVLPYRAFAEAEAASVFETAMGEIAVHPVDHASFVMTTPVGTIYNDPVGGAEKYKGKPAPDLILVTHQHGDHYDVETLRAIVRPETRIISNPAVFEMLPPKLKSRTTAIENGDEIGLGEISLEALPAYNITESRLKYHPQGRDNGYLVTVDGMRIYIAGDTEDIPEMRALTDIDVAFVPMNLPYTMDVEAAADAVRAFAPSFVFPYHYRGSDPEEFGALVEAGDGGTVVKYGAWYG